LIELMIVVAIIGILASVAIPAFVKNARKAKTTEATVGLQRMYTGSRSYVLEETVRRAQVDPIPPQFPESAALTPAATCCASPGRKCTANPALWTNLTWQAVRFDMADPHYYQYEYQSTGTAGAGAGSRFTARAMGDLDCDGILSTYEMVGELSNIDNDVHGSGGIFQNLGIE
jgi:type IV pilus assembly protein PilA